MMVCAIEKFTLIKNQSFQIRSEAKKSHVVHVHIQQLLIFLKYHIFEFIFIKYPNSIFRLLELYIYPLK